MTEEDKKLLLKDLCARLPYHPLIKIYNDSWEGCALGEFDNNLSYHHVEAFVCSRIEIQPYLRPTSTMTEEEENEYIDLRENISAKVKPWKCFRFVDWLNSHQFDYCGLIEKGLALEAPEEIYNS